MSSASPASVQDSWKSDCRWGYLGGFPNRAWAGTQGGLQALEELHRTVPSSKVKCLLLSLFSWDLASSHSVPRSSLAVEFVEER